MRERESERGKEGEMGRTRETEREKDKRKDRETQIHTQTRTPAANKGGKISYKYIHKISWRDINTYVEKHNHIHTREHLRRERWGAGVETHFQEI